MMRALHRGAYKPAPSSGASADAETGSRADASSPQAVSTEGFDPARIWPIFEFRPLERDLCATVCRYAEGAWLPDDGEFDVAFIAYGWGAPMAYYVRLPYQRNIVWSGLTQHWRGHEPAHPRGNPWHYMLRDGESEWGGSWDRDRHPNEVAGRAAMNECCSRNSCANGSGPEFKIGDPYIAAGLVRERDSGRIVTFPEAVDCMYCGAAWQTAHTAKQVAA